MSTVTDRSLFLAVQDVINQKGNEKGMRARPKYGEEIKPEVMKDLKDIVKKIPPPMESQDAYAQDTRDSVCREMMRNTVSFKIIDLGNATVSHLAKILIYSLELFQQPGATKVACTVEYRPPENVFDARLDFNLDTWSVGAVVSLCNHPFLSANSLFLACRIGY